MRGSRPNKIQYQQVLFNFPKLMLSLLIFLVFVTYPVMLLRFLLDCMTIGDIWGDCVVEFYGFKFLS